MPTHFVPGPKFMVSRTSDWWREGSVDGDMFLRNGQRYCFEAHPTRDDLVRCTQQHPVRLGDAGVGQIKWDYKVVSLPPEWTKLTIQAELDAQGNEGFELVTVVGDYAYLKRMGVHKVDDAHDAA